MKGFVGLGIGMLLCLGSVMNEILSHVTVVVRDFLEIFFWTADHGVLGDLKRWSEMVGPLCWLNFLFGSLDLAFLPSFRAFKL